jgi:hypothetical protein
VLGRHRIPGRSSNTHRLSPGLAGTPPTTLVGERCPRIIRFG